jgi:hypothetical protein
MAAERRGGERNWAEDRAGGGASPSGSFRGEQKAKEKEEEEEEEKGKRR